MATPGKVRSEGRHLIFQALHFWLCVSKVHLPSGMQFRFCDLKALPSLGFNKCRKHLFREKNVLLNPTFLCYLNKMKQHALCFASSMGVLKMTSSHSIAFHSGFMNPALRSQRCQDLCDDGPVIAKTTEVPLPPPPVNCSGVFDQH